MDRSGTETKVTDESRKKKKDIDSRARKGRRCPVDALSGDSVPRSAEYMVVDHVTYDWSRPHDDQKIKRAKVEFRFR